MSDKEPQVPLPGIDYAGLIALTNEGNALQKSGDIEGAIQAYEHAAKNGFLGAMGNLADALVFYYPEDDEKYAQALGWYEKAAFQARDHVTQAPNYHWRNEVQDGGVSDVFIKYGRVLQAHDQQDEARVWYEQCAGLGDPRGYSALAHMHTAWNPQHALELWGIAADLALASLQEINRDREALETALGKTRLQLLIDHRTATLRQYKAVCANEPLPDE